jgi:hypothetical protein
MSVITKCFYYDENNISQGETELIYSSGKLRIELDVFVKDLYDTKLIHCFFYNDKKIECEVKGYYKKNKLISYILTEKI